MYIPKLYGKTSLPKCPFCEKQAIVNNPQKVPVCQDHKYDIIEQMRCICGREIELKTGKYGPYGECLNCGNINFKKLLAVNS